MKKLKSYFILLISIILLFQACNTLNVPNEEQSNKSSSQNDKIAFSEDNTLKEVDNSKINLQENTSSNVSLDQSDESSNSKIDFLVDTQLKNDSKLINDTTDNIVTKLSNPIETNPIEPNPDKPNKKNLSNSYENELVQITDNSKSNNQNNSSFSNETIPTIKNETKKIDSTKDVEEKPMSQISIILLLALLIIIFIYTTVKYSNKYKKEKLRNEKLNITTIEDSINILNQQKEFENHLKEKINQYDSELQTLKLKKSDLSTETDKLTIKVENSKKRLRKIKELYNAINYSVNEYHNDYLLDKSIIEKLSIKDIALANEYAPTVLLDLKYLGYKDLRKEYNSYFKLVKDLLEKYKKFYTSKSNITIYNLMVMALQAELQNILYKLKYEKLDDAIAQVKDITSKYLTLCINGNRTIKPTLARFIGELEYLYIAMIKVEYEYYIKKEQAKQEQQAIRQQMKEEAEEIRRLKEEERKIKEEESKYISEINNLKSSLETETDETKRNEINLKIQELNVLTDKVKEKKDEILRLQNGKAGNVYIISNLGSFGNNVFKIGMTRRLDPQERVNELGSASVPFRFDVHSFIFSEDAVSLEKELHNRLNKQRVNKVNLRKEFFNVTLDELEDLVLEINPTAEFNKTIVAEEYYQSESQNVS